MWKAEKDQSRLGRIPPQNEVLAVETKQLINYYMPIALMMKFYVHTEFLQ